MLLTCRHVCYYVIKQVSRFLYLNEHFSYERWAFSATSLSSCLLVVGCGSVGQRADAYGDGGADVVAKFNDSAWGKKLAKRAAKASMTDFDRYKATVAKMTRAKSVRETFKKLHGKDA